MALRKKPDECCSVDRAGWPVCILANSRSTSVFLKYLYKYNWSQAVICLQLFCHYKHTERNKVAFYCVLLSLFNTVRRWHLGVTFWVLIQWKNTCSVRKNVFKLARRELFMSQFLKKKMHFQNFDVTFFIALKNS